jgi:lipoprotein-releasing system permease protein
MYKWFLAWRYLHTKLIAFAGVLSVTLCVALVLVVMSVMGGFLDTVRERSRGLHSEIVLEGGTLQGFPYYEEFSEFLHRRLPNMVQTTTPVIYTYGIFRVPATTWTKPVRILGIRLQDYVKVNDFEEGLQYERYYPGTTHLGLQSMPVAGLTGMGERQRDEGAEGRRDEGNVQTSKRPNVEIATATDQNRDSDGAGRKSDEATKPRSDEGTDVGWAVPNTGADGAELRLPHELEEANARWRRQEKEREAIARFDASPFERSPYPDVTPFTVGERVFAADLGDPRYEGPERYGVIVGCDLLNERRPDGNFNRYIARGAEVALIVLPLSRIGTATGEPPIRVPLRYADDSRTGIFEIDDMCVYIDFDMLQEKLAMSTQQLVDGGSTKARANQLLVGLKEGTELNAARDRIAEAWADFCTALPTDLDDADAKALYFAKVYTWEDLQRPLIAAVEKEKVLVTFLFALMSVVAIALVGLVFYMIVEKKTKDIGILKAVGASSSGIGVLFIGYAAAVGLAGAILGTIIGSLFVWNINDIQDFLANLNPQLRVWSPEVYSFDRIPEVVKRADVLWVTTVAVLASMVGSLIPAGIAGRVWPVQALRYE